MTTALPMLSAAGAVKGFGQSVNNLLRHSVFAANDSAAMQKVRDIQMSKALWENGSMEEMILTDHSRDILGNFRTDTKAETNDKLQHLKDLGLDASGIEKEVLRRRAVLEAARRQRETEADTRAAQEVDQTRGREDISTNPYAGQRANMSAVKKVIGGLVDGFKGLFGNGKLSEKEIRALSIELNQIHEGDWNNRRIAKIYHEELGYSREKSDVLAKKSCVSASTYIQLKASGADVGSYGDFYKDMVQKGYIKEDNAFVDNRFKIAEEYGKKGVEVKDYNEFVDLMNAGEVNVGQVAFRTKNGQHNIVVYNSKNNINVVNVGKSPHNGKSFSVARRHYRKVNFKYFYYVK